MHLVRDFVERTTPAQFDRDDWRIRLRRGRRTTGVTETAEEADEAARPADAPDARVELTLVERTLERVPSVQ